jgi:hypothetical protein
VTIGPEAGEVGARLVGDLRNAGIPAVIAFEERPLKAQLRMADRSGASYAAIVGEREVAASTAIEGLSDGEQEQVPIGDVVNWLSRTDWAAGDESTDDVTGPRGDADARVRRLEPARRQAGRACAVGVAQT